MRTTTLPVSATLAAVLVAAVALTGCAGQAPTTEAEPSSTEGDAPTVGIFVTNAFGDRSYFDSAAQSIDDLESEYNATVSTYEAKLDAQAYAPLLQDAADANELVFVLGDQATDITVDVAAQNPDTTFVLVNGTVPQDGVATVAFDYTKVCYPAGVIAAQINEAAGRDTVGFVGGFTTPTLTTCQDSFIAAANESDPGLGLVSQTAGTFSDPNKGFEVATALAQQGSYSTLVVAGLTTQGVVKAASEGAELVPITIDFGEPSGATAAGALTHIDIIMLETAAQHFAGDLETGNVQLYSYENDAVEWLFNDELVTEELRAEVEQIVEQIKSGELTVGKE